VADENVRTLLAGVLEDTARTTNVQFTDAAFGVLYALLVERDRQHETLSAEQIRSSINFIATSQAVADPRHLIDAFDVVRTLAQNWCSLPPFCDRPVRPEPARVRVR
jgi:hypothetical protein